MLYICPGRFTFVYVKHQMINIDTIERRLYQEVISASAIQRSTLVVLPTGIGKTVIALMLMAETLRTKKGNILFLAPTKPLVEQHASSVKKFLVSDKPIVLTGEMPPAKRKAIWGSSQIICATPQVVSNDLISGQIDLNDISLIVFDEAHRATGDYAYVFIAEKYARVKGGHVLGMTASPGHDKEKIMEVCDNLRIKGVEIRHDYDPDVVKYVHDVKIFWKEVKVPKEMKKILDFLKEAKKEQLAELQKLGYMKGSKYASTKDLLAANREIRAAIGSGSEDPSMFEASSVVAVIMKLNHAQEMAETQGLGALRSYFEKLTTEASSKGSSKASKTTIALPKFQLAMHESKVIELDKMANPKLKMVSDIVQQQLRAHKHSKVIVFTHYRETSEQVVEMLEKLDGIKPARFVGQASKGSDKGLNQKKQVELIDRFKGGEINVLVATSVAEEGLDIPATDLVIFYEPVPSEIRTIQRRGRTGRQSSGKVFILIYKGTRDESYYWSSRHKEARMQKELDKLRRDLKDVLWVGESRMGNFETFGSGSVSMNGRDEHAAMYEDAGNGAGKPQRSLMDFEGAGKTKAKSTPEAQPVVKAEGQPDEKAELKIEPIIKAISEPKIEKKSKTEAVKKASGIPASDEELVTPAIEQVVEEERPTSIDIYEPSGDDDLVRIIVDTREFNSSVVRQLSMAGFIVDSKTLDVGDYIVSDRVGIERKEVDDLIHSMKDGRLFTQIRALKRTFPSPLMIIEGENLYSRSGLGKPAIMGAIASIAVDFGVSIMTVKDAAETAELVGTIAKREHAEGRIPALRSDKGTMLLQERQQFIIEGLPNISAVLAQRLLSHFGSAQAIMDAETAELQEVKGIGKGIAQGIKETLEARYYSKEKDKLDEAKKKDKGKVKKKGKAKKKGKKNKK